MNFKTVSVFLFFFLISVVFGQSADTVLTRTDSTFLPNILTKTDTMTIADSTQKSDDINSVIYASASDSVSFSISGKKMRLYGKGKLTYEQSKLEGGKILVDFTTNQVEAFGIKDTSDTTGAKLIQTPVLSEANDTYKGKRLKYNFKTKQGFISHARNDTKKDSRYEGAKVKKIDADTYYVEDGLFTTCESDTPHTHFKAKRMKIINKKVIVAEWIWMYIAQIPMPLPLPFGIFPMQSGRRSGIIIPRFSSSSLKGQMIEDFGYYWGINDYMDLKITGDYYTRGGYAIGSEYRYKKRYFYSGSIALKYARLLQGEKTDKRRVDTKDWRIFVRHNQKLSPTSYISIDVNYQTSTFNRNTQNNPYDGLKQNITSNATYSKNWEGASLSANFNMNQDLVKDDMSLTLPDIRFTKSRFYPFASSNSKPDNRSWYEEIAVTYNSHLTRRQQSKNLGYENGVEHNLDISAAPKAGHINISPTFNYTERWYDKYTIQELVVDSTDASGKAHYSVKKTDRKGFNRVIDFRMGLSVSTKFYGMLNLNKLGIEAFRHIISPSISYTYTPDFSKEKWGYFATRKDESGKDKLYSIYESYLFGAPNPGESQSINFSVNNVWEMKTQKDPTDTTSKAKKITLLSLTASTGYDIAATKFNLSDLFVNYNTSIGEYLNLSGSNRFTFYDINEKGEKLNKYLINRGKGLMRMTSFSLSISTSLSGEKLTGKDEHQEKPQDNVGNLNNTVIQDQYYLGNNRIRPDFSLPWNLGLNINYSYYDNGKNIARTARAGFDGGFNLTKNWKFTFRGSYDFMENELSTPTVSIHRSLHCWEMNFSWTPTGYLRGYNFEIRMVSPMFKDIKVEKSRRIYSGLR